MRPSVALESHRGELRSLAGKYGLSRPRVFGSVLSGTDREESDLDLLVEPAEETTLLTLAGLQIDAEELLGVHVSVLTPDGLPPKFRNQVLVGPGSGVVTLPDRAEDYLGHIAEAASRAIQ